VTGYTASAGWANRLARLTLNNQGNNDIFVAKLNPAGTTLLYATYLGGSGVDIGTGIAIDGSGNAYVTGYTASAGWATAGAYDSSYNGGYDAFVAKLNGTGSSLLYATYLGAASADYGYGIAVDGSGIAYTTGYTASAGWATAGAYDTTYNGGGRRCVRGQGQRLRRVTALCDVSGRKQHRLQQQHRHRRRGQTRM